VTRQCCGNRDLCLVQESATGRSCTWALNAWLEAAASSFPGGPRFQKWDVLHGTLETVAETMS
jgi:hypothetical protein